MKKLLLLAVCCAAIAGCHKAYNPGFYDYFTLTDGPIVFKDSIWKGKNGLIVCHDIDLAEIKDTIESSTSTSKPWIEGDYSRRDTNKVCVYSCHLHKAATGSTFSLTYNLHSHANIVIKAVGPATGTGIFRASRPFNEYASQIVENTYVENFEEGKPYNVDSVRVNISKANGDTVVGKYKIWLSGASDSKKITGTINCYTAKVD